MKSGFVVQSPCDLVWISHASVRFTVFDEDARRQFQLNIKLDQLWGCLDCALQWKDERERVCGRCRATFHEMVFGVCNIFVDLEFVASSLAEITACRGSDFGGLLSSARQWDASTFWFLGGRALQTDRSARVIRALVQDASLAPTSTRRKGTRSRCTTFRAANSIGASICEVVGCRQTGMTCAGWSVDRACCESSSFV